MFKPKSGCKGFIVKRAAILAIVLLVAVIAVIGVVSNSLIASSESPETGSNPDAESKIDGTLAMQVRLKIAYLEDPEGQEGKVNIFDLKGVSTDDLSRQTVFIYFLQEPTPSQVKELEDMGIILRLDSWIPYVDLSERRAAQELARPQVLLIEDLDAALRQLEEWGISLQDLEEWGITWQEIEDSRITMEELGNWFGILQKFNERGVTLRDLEGLGITLCPDPSIAPAVNLPAGIMVANIPVYKLYDLASKDYVVRLSTAEGSFELHNDSAPGTTNADDLWPRLPLMDERCLSQKANAKK
jgi:hypothetical protein